MKLGVYITCGLLLLSGCTQANWRQSVSHLAPSDTQQAAQIERIQTVEKLLDDVEGAPQASRGRPRVTLLRAQNPDQPAVAVTSSSADKTATISHDAKTLELIDKETKDFSPDDRARAIAVLKAIPSDSVPAVLQLWKAGLISPLAKPTTPVVLAPQSASDLPPPTLPDPAASGSPPTNSETAPPAAGTVLGQNSPWGNGDSSNGVTRPPDWHSLPGNGTSARTQQIARVTPPAMGYSSPFASTEPRVGLLEAAELMEQSQSTPPDFSPTAARGAATRGSMVSGFSPVMPPDWPLAPNRNGSPSTATSHPATSHPARQAASQAARQAPTNLARTTVARTASRPPQGSIAGEPQITPQRPTEKSPTENSLTDRTNSESFSAESISTENFSTQAIEQAAAQIASMGTAARAENASPISRPGEPLIQAAGTQTSARTAIERAGFDTGLSGNSREIPLSPGQTLPGFPPESNRLLADPAPSNRPGQAATLGQPNPLGEVASPALASASSLDSKQDWSMPPSPHREIAPQSALQILISATEGEVSQLAPGQSAVELQYYIERQVYLRLLYLMAGESERALRPIPNIPAADQEFWTQVVWGVHNYFDLQGIPNHADRAAQTVGQFNTAMLKLKERAPLELKNVTFCHTIDGYGEYETYSQDEFIPGQRVLVYAEVANFHSELSAEGIYRTRLKSTLEVESAEAPGDPIDVKIYPVTEDYCRNHRRDYFHSYVVEIPVRCVRGSHVLKLIVEDEQSGKTAMYPLSFVVR